MALALGSREPDLLGGNISCVSTGSALQTENVTEEVVSSGSWHAGVRWASCKELVKPTSKEIRSSTSNVHVQEVTNEAARLGVDSSRPVLRSSRPGLCGLVFSLCPAGQHPLEANLSLHEGAGRLVVDAGQAGDVTDQLVQQSRLQQISLLRDKRLLCEDNILGGGRISAEQPPVDEASVPEVGVLALLSGEAE